MDIENDSNFDEDLIDQVRAGSPHEYRFWEPNRVMVIVGRSNSVASEVDELRCREDGVPILRRRGGGGAVVLSPGILVLSLVKQASHLYFGDYFKQINNFIIEALQTMGMEALSQKGHSDICLHDRKILGSCMFGSRNLLFYTASLMINNDLSLIEKYLKHPSREPDYRLGRAHRDFVTNICSSYANITLQEVLHNLEQIIPTRIHELE